MGGAFLASDTAGILALLVFFSLWFNYFAFCEWRWGQTIGKNATGIEVRSLDGARRLTYGQASIRNLLRLIDFFVIGEVMIVDRPGASSASGTWRRRPWCCAALRGPPPLNGLLLTEHPPHNA